ncbi:MAG: M48 family metallopeptidase [Calditrichaeota bacterium]|nr:M48 family metallopeptidase [Calditrichota bacterium]
METGAAVLSSRKSRKEEKNLPKAYTRTHLVLSLIDYALTLIYFLLLIFAGGSLWLGKVSDGVTTAPYAKLIVFVLLVGFGNWLILSPLEVYSGFILEHKYGLSNQTFFQWVWEGVKGVLVGLLIFLPLVIVLYSFLRAFPVWWWVPVGFIIFLFSVVLAQLAPILIFPLFYKFRPVENEELKKKILALCEKVGVQVSAIFSFNLSKTTKKANAAFTGLGKTKRIILSDTLLEKFTPDEIEVVFAHELGHYKRGHIKKGLVLSFFVIFAGLFLTAVLYRWAVHRLGYISVDQIEALPLFFLLFMLYNLIVMPVQNAVSRRFEVQADTFALDLTQKPADFISAMDKLSRLNLSDKEPHPVVEFLFYSHPSIKKRIALAEKRAGG